MTELKKAAKNLLTTLQTAAKNPGDVKVSIVPFNTAVNGNRQPYRHLDSLGYLGIGKRFLQPLRL